MPTCPVEGCDVSFAKQESVIGHVQGSKGIHKGHSFTDAKEALESGSSLPAMGSDGAQDTATDTSGSGEGLGMPGSSEASTGGADVPDCPKCGEPLDDPKELKKLDQFQCDSCGHGPMRWTE